MSRIVVQIIAVVLTIVASTTVLAQGSASRVLSAQGLADARALIQAGRKEVIQEELRLTKEEEAAFWPLYEKYRGEMTKVLDRQADLISEYVRRYENQNLSNEYADELIKDAFDIKSDVLRVQKKYVRKYQRVLPSLKVAQFYQLENKMNAEIDAALALTVPLVDPY